LACPPHAAALLAVACGFAACAPNPASVEPERRSRDDNGLWARRVWLHQAQDDAALDALITTLRARGVTRFYPFLGPPDETGQPGWRDNETLRPVDPTLAAATLTRLAERAPDVHLHPWTGGVYGRDIDLNDLPRLTRWIDAVMALPLHGIQINVEPMPEQAAFLDLLHAWKARLGDRTLSVAAYPPPTPQHPFPDVHWSLPFLREVCLIADELAVMAYDTALTEPQAYTALVAEWTRALGTLPPPEEGGCLIWIGVPAYEDDVGWHRPDAETLAAGLAGVNRALDERWPAHVRGVAVYASWTTDAAEWATYDTDWRRRAPADTPLIDAPLTAAAEPPPAAPR
jgi:hypothetical protein